MELNSREDVGERISWHATVGLIHAIHFVAYGVEPHESFFQREAKGINPAMDDRLHMS